MTSKQTSGNKVHNPEGHNQYTDSNKTSAAGGRQNESSSNGGKAKSSTGSTGNNASSGSGGQSGGTQGGTHEQHVKAGQQSHKNS